MASPSKVSIEDLMISCGLEDASLDREIATVQFHGLSCYLTQWKLIAPNLGVSKDKVVAIERDNQGDQTQSIAFLYTWQQVMSIKATYRVLVSALLSVERAADARGVCNILKGKQKLAVKHHTV